MEYNLYIRAKEQITNRLKNLFKNYKNSGVEYSQIKKWISKKTNFENIIEDINNEGIEFFESTTEYKNFVRDIAYEVLNDLIALDKDYPQKDIKQNNENMINENANMIKCPHCGYELKNNNSMQTCPECGTPITPSVNKINESKEVKKFKDYFNNIINENENSGLMNMDDIVDGITPLRKSHKQVISSKFNIPYDYIEIISKRKHQFKVHDMKGDVLGNARVSFDVYVFSDDDLQKITNNIEDYCVDEYCNRLPDTIDVIGIKLSPVAFIDKQKLKESVEKVITNKQTISIINQLTKIEYESKYGDFNIWTNKKSVGVNDSNN